MVVSKAPELLVILMLVGHDPELCGLIQATNVVTIGRMVVARVQILLNAPNVVVVVNVVKIIMVGSANIVMKKDGVTFLCTLVLILGKCNENGIVPFVMQISKTESFTTTRPEILIIWLTTVKNATAPSATNIGMVTYPCYAPFVVVLETSVPKALLQVLAKDLSSVLLPVSSRD